MRVYFLTEDFPKLSETFILQQISGLIDLGYDVYIIATALNIEGQTQPIFKNKELQKKTILAPVPKKNLKTLSRCSLFYLKKVNRLFGYKFNSKYHLYLLTQIPYLMDLKIDKNDTLICNFGPVAIKAAAMKRFGKQFKLISVFHGHDMSAFLKSEPRNVYEDVFRMSNKILCISNFWKNKLISLSCPSDKIIVLRMGVNTDYFLPVKDPINSIRYLSVGRLVEKKGFEYSIRAFAECFSGDKSINYNIIGSGPLYSRLSNLIHSLGVADQIKLLGGLDTAEVVKLMREATVFVVPSVTAENGDMEGLPVVLLEASSLELAIISTRHSGISEGLIDGKTGILVEERNIEQLKSAMLYLFENPMIRKQYGKNARIFIEKEFSLIKTIDELSSVVNSL